MSALSFGLLPGDLAIKAAGYLAEDVSKFKHLTTGFLGTPLLCETLSDIGRDDLAFMLLERKNIRRGFTLLPKGQQQYGSAGTA